MSLKIDIDVKGVVQAEKVVKRSFDNIEKESKNVDRAVTHIEKAFKNLHKTSARSLTAMKSNTRVLRKIEKAVKNNASAIKSETAALRKEIAVLQKATAAQKKYNTTKKKTSQIFNIAVGNMAAMAVSKITENLKEGLIALKEYSDSWIKFTNIIKLGVNTQEELIRSRQKVLDIAQETRTDLMAQATLYNRLTLSQKDLGVSQKEILDLIRGVGHALGVTATTALESRGSLIQLAQAFGQPIVRAEEFNSVLEGTPRIAKAVADGLGLTRAQLRRLVLAGKLTNKELFKAFQTQLPELEREFANVAPTIAQGFINIKTGLIAVVGQFNELTGVAPAVATALSNIGKKIGAIAKHVGELAEATSDKSLAVQLKIVEDKIYAIEHAEELSYKRRLERQKKWANDHRKSLLTIESPADLQNRKLRWEPFSPKERKTGVDFSKKALLTLESQRNNLFKKMHFQELEMTRRSAEEKQKIEHQKLVETTQLRINAVKKAFKSTGIVSKQGIKILIKEIDDEKKANIKAGMDRVTAEKVAWAKITQIYETAYAKEFKLDRKRADRREREYQKEQKRLQLAQRLIDKRDKTVYTPADKIAAETQAKLFKKEHEKLYKDMARMNKLTGKEATLKPAKTELEKYVNTLNESLKTTTLLENVTVNAFKSMEDAITEYIMTGKLGFKDLARTALAEITRIYVRSAIIKPMANAVSSSNLLSSVGSMLGNLFHTGGVVGQATTQRSVDPVIFNSTPKFHDGLLPGEYPAILKQGETVRTPEQEKALYKTPIVNINIENNKEDASVTTTQPFVDDQGRMTIGIVIDALQRNVGGLRDITKAVVSG